MSYHESIDVEVEAVLIDEDNDRVEGEGDGQGQEEDQRHGLTRDTDKRLQSWAKKCVLGCVSFQRSSAWLLLIITGPLFSSSL